MKSKLLLTIIIFFGTLRLGFATQFTVSTSGFTFVPNDIPMHIGDTVNMPGSSTHPPVQVDLMTWTNLGNTPLAGGWGVKFSNFMFIATAPGDIYYVCNNHHGSGMRGKFTIPASITEYKVVPPNPTSLDTIKIAVSSMFTSSPCNPDSFTVTSTGNIINITGYYCTGILTAICNRTDTVKINPLPAGNYAFHFTQMVSGNCDGIYAEENTASGAATVTFTSGIPDIINSKNFSIYPNPVKNGELHIDILNGNYTNSRFLFYTIQGQLLADDKLYSNKNLIKTKYAPGIYFYRIMNDDQELQQGKIQIE